MKKKNTLLPCSTCGRETDFLTPPIGPFCSERCKLNDLGNWFKEDYRISEPLRPEHFEEFEELSDQNPDPSDH